MAATVVLLGTLDTKGPEYAYLRDQIAESGCEVVMVNAGVLGDPAYPVEFGREEVAAAVGADLAALVEAADRGAAVTAMAAGAAVLVRRLFDEGRLHGILGAAGSGGTAIISTAMRSLPVGVPKMLVSTLGASDTRPFVGTTDIAMMYSVVDIAGINPISAEILGNAAAGIAAMAVFHAGREAPVGGRPLVGATMYGATTACVDHARRRLEEAGYEVLVFHATGTGGRSMEALMASGHITACLDVTTAEVLDEVAGGVFTAGPDRLEMAGRLGLPQVVTVGAADMIAFSPPETLPPGWAGRNLYIHNPFVTLVRSNAEECDRLGRVMAEKLSAATGPLTVFIPLRGTSSYGVEGGVFHDPEADRALFDSLRRHLDPSVELVEMDTDINDPVFAEAMAGRLDEHYRGWLGEPLGT
ncbi:MAG: Tm-1-like ATP-binding domain-containing protein [Actinobacteria bacterium]|nr:Tm-1-like ATP-binding domain-containing protein [Actinomycetota bacterium]